MASTPVNGSVPPPLSPPLLRARTPVLAAAAVVLLAWLAMILLDGLDLGGARDSRTEYVFRRLFNDRPVEWLQWFALAALAVGAAYTAGRLTGTALRRERAFWFLIAVGVGLMLIEDAGDVRQRLSGDARDLFGGQPLGIHIKVLVDVPYFAALAAVPVYALLRHGPVIWTYRPVRPYLAAGFALYALAAGASGIRHLGGGAEAGDRSGLYSTLGEQLNRLLGIEQLPGSDFGDDRFHFRLIDGPVEESVELLAVAALLAALLAFVATVSSRADDGRAQADARPPT